MATTTKADLVEAVYERIGLSRPKSTAIVEQVFEMITQRLELGETVKLSGSKRARPGRNPKTGEPIEITSRKVVTYRASPLVLTEGAAEDED
ncbi:MAG: integration host factor subunit alpha [Magnetococcus sp. YQC-9]